MRRTLLVSVICCFVALSVFTSSLKSAQVIVPIATSNALGGFGMSVPSINNNSQVAFIDTSPGTNGVYIGNIGPLTTVVTSPTLFNQYGAGGGNPWTTDAGPTLNDAGVVAFWANTTGVPGAPGILSGTPGSLNTTISGAAPVGTTGFTYYTGAPQISNDGTVAFATYRAGGFPGAGVFTGSGGPLTPILSTDTEIRTLIDPAVSGSGVVAYEWKTLNEFGAPIADNLFTLNNGVTTTIATTSLSFFNYIAVNDAGTVAASSTHAIQVGDGGPFATLVDTSGPFGTFGAVSINNPGDVAFYGLLAIGGTGIFTGPDPVLDKVIATGDNLMGSTVMQLAFGRRGLNDNGQVAFWARLNNGTQGVFLATPVPEPSSVVILVTGAVVVGLVGRRRRRSAERRIRRLSIT